MEMGFFSASHRVVFSQQNILEWVQWYQTPCYRAIGYRAYCKTTCCVSVYKGSHHSFVQMRFGKVGADILFGKRPKKAIPVLLGRREDAAGLDSPPFSWSCS